jgi:hypothetical protein
MNQENPNSTSTTGMDTDEAVTVGAIEKATERAFKYQRYIARRTFGLYYLVWAAAIILVVASPNLSTLVGLSGNLGEAFQLVVRLMALAGAAGTIAVIFRDARRILILGRPLGRGRAISIYIGGLILWMFVVASAYFLAPAFDFHVVFYALLLPIPFLLYRLMSLTLPDKRPAEGLIALATFAAAAAISLAVTLRGAVIYGYTYPYQTLGWVWGLTALVWFLVASFALFGAPDELEALRG